MTARIDLNCDLGEGRGNDAAILPFVTSANVACGLHAGGPTTMRRTLQEAGRQGVAVGAHPGFADRASFGRQEPDLPPEEVYDLVAYQLGALAAMAGRFGLSIQHLKPHGGLYHQASRRAEIAEVVCAAGRDLEGALIIMGPPGSELEAAARRQGLRFAAEGFADRGYGDDGWLLARDHPRAILDDDDRVVAARAVTLACEGRVPTESGRTLTLAIQSLCLHGDDPRAPARARAIREALESAGVTVSPLGIWLR